MYKLSSAKINKYGNVQYIECDRGDILISAIHPDNFWSIIDPSRSVQDYLTIQMPKRKLYTCTSGTFALSPKAASAIKPEGFSGVEVF